MKRFLQFFNADAATLAGGGSPAAISVPDVTAPASAPKIEAVSIPVHQGAIQAAKSLGLPGVQGPKEAGFGDSAAELAAIDKANGKQERTRNPDGTFSSTEPSAPATVVKDKTPTAPKPVKPVAAKPVAAAPAPVVAKVKIGDKEMTPEEITARIAELEAKAKPAEAVKPAAEPAKPDAPDYAKLDEEFYTKESANYTPSADELDAILAGGPEAATSLARVLAKVDLNARKAIEAQLNPILDAFHSQIQPLINQQQQIQQFTKENSFLSANPDIKAHAQGLAESRKVEAAFGDKRERIQRLIVAGVANPKEVEFARAFDARTPEDIQADIAHHTRLRLGIAAGAAPAAEAPVASAPAQPPAPVVAAPKPFNGDRPGGTPAAVNESPQARMVREMNAHAGV